LRAAPWCKRHSPPVNPPGALQAQDQEDIRLNIKILPLALLLLSQSVYAVDPPGAGKQLQQIPATPQRKNAAPEIRVQQGATAPAVVGDSTKITVNRVRIDGQSVFTEQALIAASGFTPGSALTLNELRAMATRIADYFHVRGYFLAQAYLPAQDITDGGVTITVLAARYGKITLRNDSTLSDGLVKGILAGMDGSLIATAPLERRLLLLSDLPGVQVSSTLTPGAAVGSSDLLVDIVPGARFNGSIDADNQGNRYTGRNRIGATLNANELAGWGDVASVRAFTSTDGLNYVRAAYQGQTGLAKIGAAFTKMDYRLGKEFAVLDAHGTANIASLYGSYPLLRSRNNSLYAQLNYDAKKFQDKTDATQSVTDKDARIWLLNLNGDLRDDLAGGAVNNYSLSWTSGTIDIRSPQTKLIDQLTAGSNGHFNKVGLSAARLQALGGGNTSLFGSVSGQWASDNLDVSEKMGLGGVGGVRAYPGGEAYGDQGYVINLELRQAMPAWDALPGQLQLVGFVDGGTVTLNHRAWSEGPNHKTLRGTGVGMTWNGSNGLAVKLYYAHKLGSVKASSAPDAAGRFWLQAVKYF
jgi:hemolysin activation/secretion protein